MSERGEMGATGGKSEMGERCEKSGMSATSGTPLLAQTVLHAILCTLPVALVTRLSPVARRMCASEARA